MKLKRILAGVLACTMVASAMGLTSFAAADEVTSTTATATATESTGDVNGDGVVDVTDAMHIMRYIVAGTDSAKMQYLITNKLNIANIPTDSEGKISISSVIGILKIYIATQQTTPDTSVSDTETSVEDTSVSDTETSVEDTSVSDTETSVEDTSVSDTETSVEDTSVSDTETSVEDTSVSDTETSVEDTTVTESETTEVTTEDPALVESAKADLADAIAEGEVEWANDEYTDDTWNALDKALKAAKAVKADASVAEIVAATKALDAAIEALVTNDEALAAAVEALTADVAAAQAKLDAEDEDDTYTYDSASALEDAIYDAESIIDDYNNGYEVDLATVTEVKATLDEAVAGLQTESEALKAAGKVLYSDIAIAEKYVSLSRTVNGTADDATSALEDAITAAEALFSRSGNLVKDTDADDVEEASSDLQDALEAVFDALIGSDATDITDEDGAIVLEAITPILNKAYDLGSFKYETIFKATGIVLTETEANQLATAQETDEENGTTTAVETFYKEILAAYAPETITAVEKEYLAYKATSDTIVKSAKSNAKSAYESAQNLKATDYTDASYDTFVITLDALYTDYDELSLTETTTVDALTLSKSVKDAVALLVTTEQEEAVAAAQALMETAATTDGGYADAINASGSIAWATDYFYNAQIISASQKNTYLKDLNTYYAVIVEQLALATDGSNADVDATALQAAVDNFTSKMLSLRKDYYNGVKAQFDTYVDSLSRDQKANETIDGIISPIKSATVTKTEAGYKTAASDITAAYAKKTAGDVGTLVDAVAAYNTINAALPNVDTLSVAKDNTISIIESSIESKLNGDDVSTPFTNTVTITSVKVGETTKTATDIEDKDLATAFDSIKTADQTVTITYTVTLDGVTVTGLTTTVTGVDFSE